MTELAPSGYFIEDTLHSSQASFSESVKRSPNLHDAHKSRRTVAENFDYYLGFLFLAQPPLICNGFVTTDGRRSISFD